MANWTRAGLWALALVLTLSSAVWQRTTGPTYPARGEVTLAGQLVKLKLLRTHPGEGDLPVRVKVGERDISGLVAWRRFPTQDPWQALPMARRGDTLEAFIPHLPPAGKVEYKVRLTLGPESAEFPPRSAVARFRGEVSPYILIPHILCMFLGMLFRTRPASMPSSAIRRAGWCGSSACSSARGGSCWDRRSRRWPSTRGGRGFPLGMT